MSKSSDPVTRVRNDALEKFILEVAAETEAIRAALAAEVQGLQASIMAALKTGELLSRAKARCPHGLWLSYLRAEFQWRSDETARRYRHLFELSTKTTNLLNLKVPQSALYLLATPSTPDHIRDDIMRRAEAGEEFSFDEVATEIAASKAFLRAPVQSEPEQQRVSKAAHEAVVSRSPPPPQQPSNADLVAKVERDVAQEIALGLKNLAFQFNRRPNADKLVEALSMAEKEEIRGGIEAVLRIKAALDKIAGRTDQAVSIFPNWERRR